MTCCEWQLVSKKKSRLHKPAVKKYCALSPRQVATGYYKVYASLPLGINTMRVLPKTSEHARSAVILHPVYGSRAALDPAAALEQVNLGVD